MKKETYIPLASIVAIFGIFSWITDRIDSKVEKVDTKTEIIKEEVDQEENINIQQQQLIHSNTKLIEKLDKKFDKALAE